MNAVKSFKKSLEVLHILVALGLILAYFYILDLFKPSYSILLRGVVWTRVYELGLLGYGFYGLLPLLMVSLALALCAYMTGGLRVITLSKLACYVLLILTVVNLLPLLYQIAYACNPQVPLDRCSSPYRWTSELDVGLFYVYTSVYPLLMLATLHSWLLPFISRAFKWRVRLKVKCGKVLHATASLQQSNNIFPRPLGLASVIFLSIALSLIPYLPTLNPNFKPVSVDIRHYSSFLDNMLTMNTWSAVEYAFYGDTYAGNRPLYMLILYGLTNLGIPREIVLNFEASYIALFFALAVYFPAKQLSDNDLYALLASLSGILGFNMTVGMFAGYFALWTALIPFYICITLMPSLRKRNLGSLIGCLTTSIAMLFIHPWTWSLLMTILTVYLIIPVARSRKSGTIQVDKYLLTVLVANALVDLIKTIMIPQYGGLACSASLFINAFEFKNLLQIPRTLQRLSTTYVGGLFYNPLHMALALIGVLSLLKKEDETSKLIIIWVAVSSVVFMVPFSWIGPQSHLLFAMPFPLLIAEGLWALSRLLARFDSKLPKLFIIFFIVSSLTYTVRALCNLI